MNASGHDGFNEGSNILILDSPFPVQLVIGKPRSVGSKRH